MTEPYVYPDTILPTEAVEFPFPDLTEGPPEGWKETDRVWFVDSSGFGLTTELAMTAERFRAELVKYVHEHPDHGFGISGIGQFQVHVSAYEGI